MTLLLRRLGALAALALALLWGCAAPVRLAPPPPTPQRELLKDEFSELDDDDTQVDSTDVAQLTDDAVASRLEAARQAYMNALRAQTLRDSAQCGQSFEQAIDELNGLASYPGIDTNADFVELSKSIVKDFELFIQNINTLPSDAPVAVLREKLSQEVESIPIESVQSEPIPNAPRTLQVAMPVNDDVRRNLQFLTTGKGRKFIERVLARAPRFFPMIERVFKEVGVPDEVKYLAVIESGLDPAVVSWAKAVGMWQFIRTTGELYGLHANWWVDERRDPEKATRAAALHLRDLHDELHDWHCALAAYDCGKNRIKSARAAVDDSTADFWKIRSSLPRETRNYVPLYIAGALITMNPRLYGFDSLVPEAPWTFDTVHVHEAVNFDALARCAGTTAAALRADNPELLQPCTPPGVQDYVLRVPTGGRTDFGARFALLSDSDKRVLLTHVVRRRETIRSIAAAYGIASSDLAAFNGLSVHRHLARGTTLRIPISGAQLGTQADDIAASEQSAAPAGRRLAHRVRRGESVASIAQHYRVSIAALRSWNGLSRHVHPAPGTLLTIYLPASGPTAEPASGHRRWISYRARRGDTYAKVADAYDVTVQQLRSWNRNRRVIAGMRLRIYTGAVDPQPAVAGRYRVHKVRRGETLAAIAGTYGVRESDLRTWNNLSGSAILAGQRLRIYSATTSGKGDDARDDDAGVRTYRVRRGDTLGRIAAKFGVSVAQLHRWNRRVGEKNLRIGEKLVLH